MTTDGGLRKLLRERLPMVHWQAIETGGTGRGIPDLNGCYAGVEFWVELKKTGGWVVPLRPEQVAWLGRRRRSGGRVYVLTRRLTAPRKKHAKADELWLHDGSDAATLKEGGLAAASPLLICSGGPAAWDWAHLLEILSGRLAAPAAQPIRASSVAS